ncbi:MAG: hypothetical protein HRT44_00015 [Bdellovibrionales bacterium]|nr:hypothetical protein [Bdellovibrionales bacterium]NQZ17642.1 hypothetical protein [Bdellovibrionales bacterium]
MTRLTLILFLTLSFFSQFGFASSFSQDFVENRFEHEDNILAPYNCVSTHSWSEGSEAPHFFRGYAAGESHHSPEFQVPLDNTQHIVHSWRTIGNYSRVFLVERGVNFDEAWALCERMAKNTMLNHFVRNLPFSSTALPSLPTNSKVSLANASGQVVKECSIETNEEFERLRTQQLNSSPYLSFLEEQQIAWQNGNSTERLQYTELFQSVPSLEPGNHDYHSRLRGQAEFRAAIQGLGFTSQVGESTVNIVCTPQIM